MYQFNSMKQIKLSNCDLYIEVDDIDYDRLIKYNWRRNSKTKYFNIRGIVDKEQIYIGRFILGITNSELVVDHIDRNTLNNQRSNLRAISQGDNVRNSARVNYCFYSVRKTKYNSFAVKGTEAITNKDIHYGTYSTKAEALLVRDKLLLKDFGIHCEHLTYSAEYVLNMLEPIRLTKGSSSCKLKGIEKPKARKFDRPSERDIHKAVWNAPVVELARSIGCSDKAVEKWCKFHKIPKPSRGFWNKIKENKLEGQTCPLLIN